MKDSTLEKKLRRIVDEGKPKTVTIDGKKIYASKSQIREIKDREKKRSQRPRTCSPRRYLSCFDTYIRRV